MVAASLASVLASAEVSVGGGGGGASGSVSELSVGSVEAAVFAAAPRRGTALGLALGALGGMEKVVAEVDEGEVESVWKYVKMSESLNFVSQCHGNSC